MWKSITTRLSRGTRSLRRFRKLYRLAKGYQARRPLILTIKMWWRGDDTVPPPKTFLDVSKEDLEEIKGVNPNTLGRYYSGRLSSTEINKSNFKKGNGDE